MREVMRLAGGLEVKLTTQTIDNTTWWIAYKKGYRPPNHPLPAIPLQVKYDYIGCVNIDDVSDPDDPVIVYFYDDWASEKWSPFIV